MTTADSGTRATTLRGLVRRIPGRSARRGIAALHEAVLLALATGLIAVIALIGHHLNETERRRDLASTEVVMERTAIHLLWSSPARARMQDDVTGFGLYDADRKSIGDPSGGAPRSLSAAQGAGTGITPEYHLDHERETIRLVMRLGPRPAEAGAAGVRDEVRFVFLEARRHDFFVRERNYLSLRAVIPLAAVLGVVLVVILTLRLARYRRSAEAQHSAARLGETARVLSHETKNPLSAIRLEIDYLRRIAPAGLAAPLRRVDEEARRLSTLVERIDDLLRDPRGKPRRLDLAPVLREVADRLAVKRDVADVSEAAVLFDPDAFRSVLDNLVVNAVQSGGPRQEVVVAMRVHLARVEIAVCDRGAGVDPGVRDRMFEPFVTTKVRGSGIGLAIARRFVEAAGGHLSLAPRPGGGTEAIVAVPRCRHADPDC
jgi:signal transduction histidine kinase